MRRTVVRVLLLIIYMTEWASGQTIYDATQFYKPMTDDYDVRSRGNLFIPPCVKNLMDCWETIRPDLVCKYRQDYRYALESICMDLRLYCKEFTGPLPINHLHVVPWNYCPENLMQQMRLDLGPGTKGVNN